MVLRNSAGMGKAKLSVWDCVIRLCVSPVSTDALGVGISPVLKYFSELSLTRLTWIRVGDLQASIVAECHQRFPSKVAQSFGINRREVCMRTRGGYALLPHCHVFMLQHGCCAVTS